MDNERVLDLLGEAFSPENVSPDLVLVTAWVCAALPSVFFQGSFATPVRVALTLPLVLFIPGYALIAALFPARDEIGTIERIALSFGLSIAVVPLAGLALNYTPLGIRLIPIAVTLTLLTLALVAVAQVRRVQVPVAKRFCPDMRNAIATARESVLPAGGTPLDRALNLVLVLSIAAAIATTLFVIAIPREGENFTEFYILGSKGMASDYPETLVPGETAPIIIGVGNHEHRDVNYTVEVFLFNASMDPATNLSLVSSSERIDRFSVPLPHNSTQELRRNLTAAAVTGNELVFLLFTGTPPPETVTGTDRVNASYRDLHLWLRQGVSAPPPAAGRG